MKTNRNLTPSNENLSSKIQRCFRVYAIAVLMICMLPYFATAAHATGNGALDSVNNLADFFFSLLKAAGVIAAGFGVLQFAISFQSHDPTQRTNGILVFIGGIVIFFTKEILAAIGVSV